MNRRNFLATLGLVAAAPQLACAPRTVSLTPGGRRLRRVGIQLYTLRDDARRDLEGTLVNIAQTGYKEVELLSSMNNFGMAPARLRQILDRKGLTAPSTHVEAAIFDNLAPQIDAANILGHRYLSVASIHDADHLGLDDYRRWAYRFNEAGARALLSNIRIGFHDEAWDFRNINGTTPYDVFVQRADPAVVALQLDTGNAAVGGKDPLE